MGDQDTVRTLEGIRDSIGQSKTVVLDAETLGTEHFEVFVRIFPSAPGAQHSQLSGCTIVSSTEKNGKLSSLTVKGVIPHLFPRDNVQVELRIFNALEQRHAVVKIPVPAADSAYAYLSQYSLLKADEETNLYTRYADVLTSPSDISAATSLGGYLQEIEFSSTSSMMFSTLDFAAQDSGIREFYPSEWQKDFAVESVGRGLNFHCAKVALDEDLTGTMKERFKGLYRGGGIHVGLIEEGEEGPSLKLTEAKTTGSLGVPSLSMNLRGVSVGLALVQSLGGQAGPRILIEGSIQIGEVAHLKVAAEYNPRYPELWLSFTEFPTLKDLLKRVGFSLDSLPAPLSELLAIHLSELTFVFELDDEYQFQPDLRSVTQISFSLSTDTPVNLIKDVISLKPRLELRIDDPFDSELRSLEGELIGEWVFEGIKFTTEVSYPSLDFSASLDPNQNLSTEKTVKLIQRLLPGIELPVLTLQTMEISGNAWEKSFSAETAVGFHDPNDKKWGFSASRLKEVRFGMAYAEQQLTGCSVQCTLELGKKSKVNIVISAEYDAGRDGLQFEGRNDPAAPILIASLMEDLAELFGVKKITVPEAVETLKIDALVLSFDTGSKDFTFTCIGKVKIDTREISAKVVLAIKPGPSSVSTRFNGELTIKDDFQLSLTWTSELDKQTMIGSYRALPGSKRKQKLRELIEPVSHDLASKVPSSLEFSLQDALLGYYNPGDKGKWLFGVDIEGGLNLSDIKLPSLPLIGQVALPPDQTLQLSVQVVGATTEFTKEDVVAVSVLNTTGVKLPPQGINGLAIAASLRLGKEIKQLSLPIDMKKDGQLSDGQRQPNTSANTPADTNLATAATTSSDAQAVGDDGMQWVAIQRTYGPVHIERVGVAFSDGKITALLDAALTAGGLTITLDGLSVQSKIDTFEPKFSLRGLGIDYRNGPLEIGGSFLQRADNSFAGLAVLRTQQLSLSAIGSYAVKDGHPSLFLYAVLDYPLGGPAFFFVTGLSAGFGYNRRLTIPTIEQVAEFPLIPKENETPAQKRLPSSDEEQKAFLSHRLNALESYIPRSIGEHFLAVGVRFTSFKTINSFALLTVKFGQPSSPGDHRDASAADGLEFNLLGLSTLTMPPPVPGKRVAVAASAQLALKATFNPQTGFLGVRAQLTPKSYILSEKCRITGGFAFYSWFKDMGTEITSGDFVLTLGGYHPDYHRPAHYPIVPRLGFNWQVDNYLQLKGEAYFALTPHAAMAGGRLEAVWQKDQLRAWFTAVADFIISWQPYHYDAHIYVDVGASYTFNLFGSHTVTADMGADLHLWGPEFSGEARIHWSIISFTVSFGPEKEPKRLEPIPWDSFKAAFLPADNQICGVAVQQGLIRQMNEGNQSRWIMNAKDFVLVTNSVIPSTQASKILENGQPETIESKETALAVAVRPAGLESIKSMHTIKITKAETGTNGKSFDKVQLDFQYTPILKAVPAALWGAPSFEDGSNKTLLKPPDIHDRKTLLPKTLAGFEIRPLPSTQVRVTASFRPNGYQTEQVPDAFELKEWELTDADLLGAEALQAAAEDTGSAKRNSLLKALRPAKNDVAVLARV